MNDSMTQRPPGDEACHHGCFRAAPPSAGRHGRLLCFVAAATTAFLIAFIGRWFPLGVPGQWHWGRLDAWDPPMTTWLALMPAAFFAAGLVAWVRWTMQRVERRSRRFFATAIVGVMVLGAGFQLFLEITAPIGLRKWGLLYYGFRETARQNFSGPDDVLRRHAQQIATIGPSHASANPVGWIFTYRSLMTFYESYPGIAEMVWRHEPQEIAWMLRELGGVGRVSAADHATITTVAFGSRFLALLLPLPIAWLVAQRLGRGAALAAAAISMLIPVSSLLAPNVDTVYPTFATLIWSLSYYGANNGSWRAAGAAGMLVGLGMLYSLCFLTVGALAALLVTLCAFQGSRPTAASVAAALAGCLVPLAVIALYGHHFWETWQINLAKNHEFNRYSGCSYAVWVGVNLLEFAVAIGVPAALLLAARTLGALRSAISGRAVDPLLTAWLAIVALLDLAGMNLGEVSRLWLFLMPVGVALAIEPLALAAKHARGMVVCLLLLQAAECAVISRELLLVSPWPTHSTLQAYLGEGNRQWATLRRLTEDEFLRRQQQTGDER